MVKELELDGTFTFSKAAAVHETDENIHSKAIVAKTVFENVVDPNDDHLHDLIVDVAAT